MLQVKEISCRWLKNAEHVGKSDPYVKLYLIDNESQRTKVKSSDLDPDFDDKFEFMVNDFASQVLYFHVMDKNISSDRPLGHGQLSLGRVCTPSVYKHVTLPLEDGDEGTINMELLYRQFVPFSANRNLSADFFKSPNNDKLTSGYLFVTVISCSNVRTRKPLQVSLKCGKVAVETWSLVPDGDVVSWNQIFSFPIGELNNLELHCSLLGFHEDMHVDLDVVKDILCHGSQGLTEVWPLHGGSRSAALKLRCQLKKLDEPRSHTSFAAAAVSHQKEECFAGANTAAVSSSSADLVSNPLASADSKPVEASSTPNTSVSATTVNSGPATPTKGEGKATGDSAAATPSATGSPPQTSAPPSTLEKPSVSKGSAIISLSYATHLLNYTMPVIVLVQSLGFLGLSFFVGYLFGVSVQGFIFISVLAFFKAVVAHKRGLKRVDQPSLDALVFSALKNMDRRELIGQARHAQYPRSKHL